MFINLKILSSHMFGYDFIYTNSKLK
jgi:hypothetical protein